MPLSYRSLDVSEELFSSRPYQMYGWNITVARLFKPKDPVVSPKKRFEHETVQAPIEDSCLMDEGPSFPRRPSDANSMISENIDPGIQRSSETVETKTFVSSIFSQGSKSEVPSYDQDPAAWQKSLIYNCKTGNEDKVRRLLVGKAVCYQPKDISIVGGSEASMIAISYKHSGVVKALLDHCVFPASVLGGREVAMDRISRTRHSVDGTSQEFVCNIFLVANNLERPIMAKELKLLDAIKSLCDAKSHLAWIAALAGSRCGNYDRFDHVLWHILETVLRLRRFSLV